MGTEGTPNTPDRAGRPCAAAQSPEQLGKAPACWDCLAASSFLVFLKHQTCLFLEGSHRNVEKFLILNGQKRKKLCKVWSLLFFITHSKTMTCLPPTKKHKRDILNPFFF